MIRSYSFHNSRAFPMACATFETTAQKTLGTLACSAIYDSFSWNASLDHHLLGVKLVKYANRACTYEGTIS